MWDPSETSFSEKYDAMNEFRGEVINNETFTRGPRIINYLSTSEDHIVDFTEDNNF